MFKKLLNGAYLLLLAIVISGCSSPSPVKEAKVEESINDKAIQLISEGKFRESANIIDDDLTAKYGDWGEVKIESIPQEEQMEFNLLTYSLAAESERDGYYLNSYNRYKELLPIDGIINQEEIDYKIAYLEPKAKAIKAEPESKSGVTIGMSKDQVLKSSWGKPKKVYKTTTATGVDEQWVYGSNNYLYFSDGRLTTIQN
ncbi:hypothetical protein [Paenibacillus pini]|uniref:Lipoprotein n=1 Tax=Paenibacillus pini JCM 16418 TaxID=1236976 RepID=W7YSH7_9BACL|nr:hypothetical protein [Paenibacillus pini]GAF07576.1 hypothetical protein JCM16418_1601 [Paenibacillus pini JCM 16418]